MIEKELAESGNWNELKWFTSTDLNGGSLPHTELGRREKIIMMWADPITSWRRTLVHFGFSANRGYSWEFPFIQPRPWWYFSYSNTFDVYHVADLFQNVALTTDHWKDSQSFISVKSSCIFMPKLSLIFCIHIYIGCSLSLLLGTISIIVLSMPLRHLMWPHFFSLWDRMLFMGHFFSMVYFLFLIQGILRIFCNM